uniref:Eukaryotic translation initiation factor n=1 Tax=Solanum tuberosum TaxID=4113 RepID=M1BE02_SOLTU
MDVHCMFIDSVVKVQLGFRLQVLLGSLLSVDFQSCGLSETSFMSEQAIFYLGSIGLLGEYCPWSRKKNRHFSGQVDCMHLESFKEEQLDFSGRWKAQPALNNCAAVEFSEHS